MSEQSPPSFLRPLVAGIGFFVFFCIYLAAKGRSISAPKLTLVGGWVITSVIILIVAQFIRKKHFGWIGSFVGVLGLSLLVGAVMLALNTDQIFQK